MLGISFDSVEANRAFAADQGFTFRLLSDPERTVGLAYGAARSRSDRYAARYTYVIGADGRIREALDTTHPAGQAAALLTRL